jgi:hypothetical protein
MIEKHTASHEQGAETKINDAEAKALQNEVLKNAEKAAAEAKNHHQEKLDEIRNEIEQSSTATEALASEAASTDEPETAGTYWNSKEYREIAFKQFMGRVQKHLNGPERAASKIFHQPIIERASEVGSKTVARPSGVLMGSIFSFVISLGTYVLAKYNSYDMSYSVFIMSFIGGFLLGVLVEFLYRGFKLLLSRD